MLFPKLLFASEGPQGSSDFGVSAGLSAILYHLTDARNAAAIVREDRFKLTAVAGADDKARPGNKFFYLSCARTPNSRFFRYFPINATILVLDGEALGQRYAGGPVDYWGPDFRRADPLNNEAEDRVWSRDPVIPNATSYIKSIHVFIRDKAVPHSQAIRIFRESGIPYFVYTDEAAFRRLDTKQAGRDPLADTPEDDTPKKSTSPYGLEKADAFHELLTKTDFDALSAEARQMFWHGNWNLHETMAATLHNLKRDAADHPKIADLTRAVAKAGGWKSLIASVFERWQPIYEKWEAARQASAKAEHESQEPVLAASSRCWMDPHGKIYDLNGVTYHGQWVLDNMAMLLESTAFQEVIEGLPEALVSEDSYGHPEKVAADLKESMDFDAIRDLVLPTGWIAFYDAGLVYLWELDQNTKELLDIYAKKMGFEYSDDEPIEVEEISSGHRFNYNPKSFEKVGEPLDAINASQGVIASNMLTATPIRTLVFDFDGTITKPGEYDPHNIPDPRPEIVEKIRQARSRGIKVVIQSCRWSVHELNTPEEAAEQLKLGEAYLKKWGIPYDELRDGKPLGEAYIDDKAVSVEDLDGIDTAIRNAAVTAAYSPEKAQTTQRETRTVYDVVRRLLESGDLHGPVLDFGAGLGQGVEILKEYKVRPYEPYPKPHVKKAFPGIQKMPGRQYGTVVNSFVLNVLPPDARKTVLEAIKTKVAPGGSAVIGVRGVADTGIKRALASGSPDIVLGDEPNSFTTKMGSYQHGFTADELAETVRSAFGGDFEVTVLSSSPAAPIVKATRQGTVAANLNPLVFSAAPDWDRMQKAWLTPEGELEVIPRGSLHWEHLDGGEGEPSDVLNTAAEDGWTRLWFGRGALGLDLGRGASVDWVLGRLAQEKPEWLIVKTLYSNLYTSGGQEVPVLEGEDAQQAWARRNDIRHRGISAALREGDFFITYHDTPYIVLSHDAKNYAYRAQRLEKQADGRYATTGDVSMIPEINVDTTVKRHQISKSGIVIGSTAINVVASGNAHTWGCLMADFPDGLANQARAWAKTHVSDDAVYDTPEHEYGRESHIHTTVAYGIDPSTDPGDVQFHLWYWNQPVRVVLGKVSKFSQTDYDVLKVDLHSADLHALHDQIADLGLPGNKHPDYIPHMTLAYVKPGSCDHLLGDDTFDGIDVALTKFDYSYPPSEGAPDNHIRFKIPGTAVAAGKIVRDARSEVAASLRALKNYIEEETEPTDSDTEMLDKISIAFKDKSYDVVRATVLAGISFLETYRSPEDGYRRGVEYRVKLQKAHQALTKMGASKWNLAVSAAAKDEGFVDGHWGSSASGCLFQSADGKILLLKRSADVEEPGTWGIPGGAIPVDEKTKTPIDGFVSALQETKEEMGGLPTYDDTGKKTVFRDGDFAFTTYLLRTADTSFTPSLNWENDDFKWCDVNALPSPLHPGVTFSLKELGMEHGSQKTEVAAEFVTAGVQGPNLLAKIPVSPFPHEYFVDSNGVIHEAENGHHDWLFTHAGKIGVSDVDEALTDLIRIQDEDPDYNESEEMDFWGAVYSDLFDAGWIRITFDAITLDSNAAQLSHLQHAVETLVPNSRKDLTILIEDVAHGTEHDVPAKEILSWGEWFRASLNLAAVRVIPNLEAVITDDELDDIMESLGRGAFVALPENTQRRIPDYLRRFVRNNQGLPLAPANTFDPQAQWSMLRTAFQRWFDTDPFPTTPAPDDRTPEEQDAGAQFHGEDPGAILERQHDLKAETDPTDSPAFKAWFGASKVVDAEGKPQVVHHGTAADIAEFSHEYTGKGEDQYGSGFYFTTHFEQARGYSGFSVEKGKGTKPTVISTYLSIQNPLEAEAGGSLSRSAVRQLIAMAPEDTRQEGLENWGVTDGRVTDKVVQAYVDTFGPDVPVVRGLFSVSNDFYGDHNKEFLTAVNKVLGYDGVHAPFDDRDVWVAWFPNQIKSVKNTGGFDPKNPNIHSALNPLTFQADKFDRLYKAAKEAIQNDPKWKAAMLTNPAVAAEYGEVQRAVSEARTEDELQQIWQRYQPSQAWETLLLTRAEKVERP